MKRKANFPRPVPDRRLALLEMLNYDFQKGWMDDWEWSLQMQQDLNEDDSPGVAMSEEDLKLMDEPVPMDPEARFCELDQPQAERCQKILREYVDAWLEAKFDVSKWPLMKRFLKALNRRAAYLHGRAGGGAALVFDTPDTDPDPGESWAVYLFLPYITGEYFKGIGRCARCGKYYLRESRRRNRKYCSDRCNRYTSSVIFTRVKRSRVRQEKLDLIRTAIKDYALKPAQRAKHSTRWQVWVAKAVNKKLRPDSSLRVTQNFITRAHSKGEIEAPSGVESAVQ